MMMTTTRQRKEPPRIDWTQSLARKILLEDLEEGYCPLSEAQFSTENAWLHYQQLPEFNEVPFSQFKRQLKAHREQVLIRKERVGEEEAALIQFRRNNPRKTHNNRGEPVFDMTPGKEMLRQDVANNLHLKCSRKKLQASKKEYGILAPKKFGERVRQEVRRNKYFHFLALKTSDSEKRKKDRRSKQPGVQMAYEMV
jgi:hypothetical protein